MTPMLRLVFSLFVCALLVGTASPALGQELTCEESLLAAEESYDRGRFDEAIALLEPCKDNGSLGEEERRRAFRLLGLSYLGKDAEVDARSAVQKLLELVPNYEPDPVLDPPTFVQMVEEVRGETDAEPEVEVERQPPPPPAREPQAASSGGGVGKWLLIGGGVVAAAVVAVLLLSGSDDDPDGPTEIDEQEPNNAPSAAQPLSGTSPITVFGEAAAGDVGELGLNLDLDGDGTDDVFEDWEDWYRFTTASPGIRLVLSEIDSDLDIYLIDPDGRSIIDRSVQSGITAESINQPDLEPGTYFVAVSIFDPEPQGPTTSNYELRLEGDFTGSGARFALQQSTAPDAVDQAATYRLVPAPALGTYEAGFDAQGRLVDGEALATAPSTHGVWSLTAPVETAPVVMQPDADGYADLPLSPGWNLITSPLEVALDWTAVQAANEVSQPLWTWRGRYVEAEQFSAIDAQEAYYFYNASGLEALRLPVRGAEERVRTAPATPAFILRALRDGVESARVAALHDPSAAAGLDPIDQPAPPAFFEAASLRFVLERGPDETPYLLARDARPAPADGAAYDLVLGAPVGEPIDLVLDADLHAGQLAVLVRPDDGTQWTLTPGQPLTLVGDDQETRLRLVVGTSAFVEAEGAALVPGALTVANAPNPFTASTTIQFAIPQAADGEPVQVEVYNVLGQRIRTLVDGPRGAGMHRVTWDGTDASGALAPSGMYLYRVRAGAHQTSASMMLTR